MITIRVYTSTILSLFSICLALGCTMHPNGTPPASTQNPPVYPSARIVQVTTTKGIKGIPGKRVELETSGAPEAVLAFYTDTLQKDGWLSERTGDGIHFSWLDGCPVYGFDVVVKVSDSKVTVIETELTKEYCE